MDAILLETCDVVLSHLILERKKLLAKCRLFGKIIQPKVSVVFKL